MAAATICCACSGSETSQVNDVARPPAAMISFAVTFPPSARSPIATPAPAPAIAMAMARPIPRPPPVMIAARPARTSVSVTLGYLLRSRLTSSDVSSGQAMSAHVNVDGAVLDPDRVGAQVDEHRGAERLAAGVVEAAVVHGAFDDAAIDQAVAQQRLLVGAVAFGGMKGVVRRPVDRVRAAGMAERDDVLGVDVIGRAGGYPFSHRGQAAVTAGSGRPRPSFTSAGTLNGGAPGSNSRPAEYSPSLSRRRIAGGISREGRHN